MRVYLPSPLQSYSGGQVEVEGSGDTLAQVLDSLETQFPGIRFRMIDEVGRLRRHMRIFVDEVCTEDLDTKVAATTLIHIVAALSGG
ncbi:MAG: MoaD/ThiS family protein [Planctomycetota bacterium]|nr:MoaD/ThiS family protein [Planctomycetota bacterium]